MPSFAQCLLEKRHPRPNLIQLAPEYLRFSHGCLLPPPGDEGSIYIQLEWIVPRRHRFVKRNIIFTVVLRFPQFSVNIQAQRELEYYDEIRQSVGDDEEKGLDSVRSDTETPRKPLADNAPEKE